jgi:hypothetical protein
MGPSQKTSRSLNSQAVASLPRCLPISTITVLVRAHSQRAGSRLHYVL